MTGEMTIPSVSATGDLVLRALDAASLRHAAHAANIANVSTENYLPVRVSFESQLAAAREALLDRDQTRARRAIDSLQPHMEVEATPRKVMIDQETSLMMQNALRYQALLTALSKGGAFLRAAIQEGKR
jgi:flagellar basal-body rod protein FlgB